MSEGDQQILFEVEPTPLTPQQLRAAEMLAFGARKAAVQSRQGCTLREIAAWERLPLFQSEMQRLQSEAREACIAELRGLGDTAIGVIRRILEDDEAPASARLNAAFRLLDLIGVVPGCFSAAPAEDKPVRRTLDPETLQRISAEIYGLAD